MARKTIKQRLAELEAQRAALKARLSKTERNNDMRRKVLIGSLVLHHLETSNDQDFKQQLGEWLRRELPGFLTRDNDKALLADLEGRAKDGGAEWWRLETGVANLVALALYERSGFVRREPFADYLPDPLSVFMEKRLGGG